MNFFFESSKIYVYELRKQKQAILVFFFVLSIKLLSMYMNYLFFCPVVVGVVCRKCEITVGIE